MVGKQRRDQRRKLEEIYMGKYCCSTILNFNYLCFGVKLDCLLLLC
jgi:hypothetical protein